MLSAISSSAGKAASESRSPVVSATGENEWPLPSTRTCAAAATRSRTFVIDEGW